MTTPDRPRALVLAPVRGPGLDKLQRLADCVIDPWIEHQPLKLHSEEDLAQRLRDEEATILVSEADRAAGPVLDVGLTVIGSTRGDPTNVDLDGATAKGIPVLHCPARNADAVAELTIGLMLAASRGIVAGDDDVRTGQVWRQDGSIPYQRYRAWQLAGRTLGLVGLGAIGQAVKWRAEGLGMRVLASDPYNDEATHPLPDLLAEADVVSLHAPVTEATTGLLGKAEFDRMKEGAIFVNAARAALHDMDALVAALESGHLAAAALDHFPGEHLPTDHPLVSMSNVVLTPHIGGATFDVEANQTRMIADDVERLLGGQRPQHIANPEVLR